MAETKVTLGLRQGQLHKATRPNITGAYRRRRGARPQHWGRAVIRKFNVIMLRAGVRRVSDFEQVHAELLLEGGM